MFLQKLKHVMGLVWSFIWITLLALLCNADYESARGLEINGFICVLLWVIFMWLALKVSMVLANVGFTILHIFLRFYLFSYEDNSVSALCLIILLAGIFVVYRKRS